MDKHLPLIALAILWPSAAFGQCSGVFPPGTYCGNTTASPAPPGPTALSITGIVGPGVSTNNGLPLWSGTTGTTLKDGAGQTIIGAYTWGGAQTYSAAAAFNAGATFATGTYNFTGTLQIGGTTVTLPVSVPNGGTGNATATAHSLPINEGTSAQANTGTGTAGQLLASGGAGADPAWQTGAVFSALPANPAGTASNSPGVMMGLGATCKITPIYSGRIHLAIMGSMLNNTNVGSTFVILRWGTGAAPANGAANTGTAVTNFVEGTSSVATYALPFSVSAPVSGLTAGVQIWFDLVVYANTGTASVSGLTCNAYEF